MENTKRGTVKDPGAFKKRPTKEGLRGYSTPLTLLDASELKRIDLKSACKLQSFTIHCKFEFTVVFFTFFRFPLPHFVSLYHALSPCPQRGTRLANRTQHDMLVEQRIALGPFFRARQTHRVATKKDMRNCIRVSSRLRRPEDSVACGTVRDSSASLRHYQLLAKNNNNNNVAKASPIKHNSASYQSEMSSSTTAFAVATIAAGVSAFAFYKYVTYDKRWWWNKRRAESELEVSGKTNWELEFIHGVCAPGWEEVRREFVENFRSRGELGAAVCIYHRGVKVVDLWGGIRDREFKKRPTKEGLREERERERGREREGGKERETSIVHDLTKVSFARARRCTPPRTRHRQDRGKMGREHTCPNILDVEGSISVRFADTR